MSVVGSMMDASFAPSTPRGTMHPVSDLPPAASTGREPASSRLAPRHTPSGDEPAYRVPWTILRDDDPRFLLLNTGQEELSSVHLLLTGEGRLLWTRPLRIRPGACVAFVLRADDPARDSVVCVRWFRPNGEEYVWRVVF